MRARRRGIAAAPLVVAVLIGSFGVVSPRAATAENALQKIEPKLLQQFKEDPKATFWVVLRQRANLTAASNRPDWAARGKFVFDQLNATANASQEPIRAFLRQAGVDFEAFWIANTIKVTAPQSVALDLAARPQVEMVFADRLYNLPDPIPAVGEVGIQAIEWNVDRIRAPLVWSTFGVRGEGVVIANIDTGVQFDHPALVRQYRGNLGGGSFDHNYNWFDPSAVCVPATVPCDNNNHGTHTMGTMVGDDGGVNAIGVAPGARWIAAKGCEVNSCSLSALLASGQWVLAPTNSNGQAPRPDLRPHVVNNSWGGGPGDTFYQQTVQSWIASGIFPAFSNGNSGPGCGTAGSPGDYPETYAVGAFDANNAIATFSSRGASIFGGEVKPNISAPGVAVRSSVIGSGYAAFSGTSMAAPHVAAAVGLMWSAAPAMVGDIAATRTVLDQTAIDVANTTCGGTAADNNVWGEGRLDAFAAADRSPRGPTGTLAGTVSDATSGAPIVGAGVNIVGPINRSLTTNGSGQFSARLSAGNYDATVTSFGYLNGSATAVAVAQDVTTTRDFALQRAPSQPVSGVVREANGTPVANATVTIIGTPITPATTDATGGYSFSQVPEGTYDIRAEAGRCSAASTQQLVVNTPETLDFALGDKVDGFGYRCKIEPASFVDATTVLPLSGDDATTEVTLPFPFPFYGQHHTTAHVSTNGVVNFLGPNTQFSNHAIPNSSAPNGAIYALWDDLYVQASSSVRTETVGVAPNRRFVIEWRNVSFQTTPTVAVRVELLLHENGQIVMQYADIDGPGLERGVSATVGIEDHTGTLGFLYSIDESTLANGLAIRFDDRGGTLQGAVTDSGDGSAIVNATVRAVGPVTRTTTTGPGGSYLLRLPAGTYNVTGSAFGYVDATSTAVPVAEAASTPGNLTLSPRPSHTVAGTVRDAAGAAVPNATVTLLNTPKAPVTTDASGAYSLTRVPVGSYQVRVDVPHRCLGSQTSALVVDGAETLDFSVTKRVDSFGYSCTPKPFSFVPAADALALTGDDASQQVSLPFQFPFYGQNHTLVHITTNGTINFTGANTDYFNVTIPNPNPPNGTVSAFWDDLLVDATASVRTQTLGAAPNRQFVIEWRNVALLANSQLRLRFEIILFEDGRILVQYTDIGPGEDGTTATVGIEDHTGSGGFLYSFNEAVISNNFAVEFGTATGAPPAPPPPTRSTTTFSGEANPGATPGHNLNISAVGPVDMSLNWDDTRANLGMRARNPAGTIVFSDTGASKPKVGGFSATTTGTWRFEITNSSGRRGRYTLTVTFPTGTAPPPPPPPPPDGTPPNAVSVTAPAGGSTVSGTLTFSAAASDNVGVTQVLFFVGTTQVGSDTSSPYSIQWNTNGTSNGQHNLTVQARDAAGNATTSAAVSVTVNNTAPIDTVTISRAEYSSGNRELRVQASSNMSGAVLQVFVTSTNQLIGTISGAEGRFTVAVNPVQITVRSSLGGSATRAVQAN